MKFIFIIILIFCFKISFSQTIEAEKIKKEQIEKQKRQNIEDASKMMNAESVANYKKYLEEKERIEKQNSPKYSSTHQGAKAIDPNIKSTSNNQKSENQEAQEQPYFPKITISDKQAFEKQKQQNIEDVSKKMNAVSEADYKKYLEEKEKVEKQNSTKYSSTQQGANAIDPNTNTTSNNQKSENKAANEPPDFSKMTTNEKQAFEKQKQQNIEDAGKQMNAESEANYKKYLEEQKNLNKQTKSQGSTSTKIAEEKK